MKEGIRIVDQYQLLQYKSQIIDGLQFIPARHIIQNKMYSVKKLKLNGQNKSKYSALINQINILKQLRDEKIIVCHNLFKTNSSLYVTYDYISENTLQSYILEHRSILSYKQKLKIAMKLAQFFLFLKRNNIVNLNITPKNIQVLFKRGQIYLRFNNFQYAIQLNKPTSQVIIKNLPISQFMPFEIQSQETGLSHSSSIYTLRKLFEFIQLYEQNSINSSKSQQKLYENMMLLKQTVQRIVTEKQSQRPTIEHIIDMLNDIYEGQVLNKTIKSQNYLDDLFLSTHSKKKLSMQKVKSCEEWSQRSKTARIRNTEQIEEEEYKKKLNQYCLMIIKARNLSLFLLKCCQVCLKVDLLQVDQVVEVSFLLLKKSTSIMNQLYKFMLNGRHKEIFIPHKQFKYFSKSADYFRLQTIIWKDLNFSKKYLSQTLKSIHQNYQDLLKCSNFKKETSNEEVNKSYMKLRTIQFLKTIIQNSRLKSIQKDSLKYFHILSYLLNFDSFEEMFKQLINQQILQLERQTLFINSTQMDHQALIQKLPELDKYLAERKVEL